MVLLLVPTTTMSSHVVGVGFFFVFFLVVLVSFFDKAAAVNLPRIWTIRGQEKTLSFFSDLTFSHLMRKRPTKPRSVPALCFEPPPLLLSPAPLLFLLYLAAGLASHGEEVEASRLALALAVNQPPLFNCEC